MGTIKINGVETQVPAAAIAYKYADPTEDARWVYDQSDLASIRREDPSLIVEVGTTYHWATDAASGQIFAASADAAFARLVEQGEWAEMDSAREGRDIANGAWLMIGEDAAGERLIVRGNVP